MSTFSWRSFSTVVLGGGGVSPPADTGDLSGTVVGAFGFDDGDGGAAPPADAGDLSGTVVGAFGLDNAGAGGGRFSTIGPAEVPVVSVPLAAVRVAENR